MQGRRRGSRRRAIGSTVVLVLTVASCGDSDDDGGAGGNEIAALPATTAVAATTSASSDGFEGDACALVPTADVAAASDLAVDDGAPGGDERRRVCTFQVPDAGVGITVGIESADGFEEKAATSRRSLGVEGEPVDGLGDAALFFFSDDDLPEGVGGTLVGVGPVTIDVTLQGLDEDELRRASVAIAELAVGNL